MAIFNSYVSHYQRVSSSERGHHRVFHHHPRPGLNAAGGKSWQLAIQLLEALKMQFSRFKVI